MRGVRLRAKGKSRVVYVPETYSEAYNMLVNSMDPMYSTRGGNAEKISACAAVAYGLFADDITPDPTTALVFLMQRLCKGEGRLEARDARQDSSASGVR